MLTLKELKQIKQGDWLFACAMEPKQFKEWEKEKNPKDYSIKENECTGEEWEIFLKYSDFETLGGSSHSTKCCGLKPISEKYALWFIENKCWTLFDSTISETPWVEYENKVKELCNRDNINYEGI